MNKHLFLIGDIKGLNIKKDSSLLLAHSLKKKGAEVFIVQEKDFYILPHNSKQQLYVQGFESTLFENQFYMQDFNLKTAQKVEIDDTWTLHMRCDPPVDQRYTRFLWMLMSLKHQGVRITNDPNAIIQFNEKLMVYNYEIPYVNSYYGEANQGLRDYLSQTQYKEIIVKPMDSFSGIGVEKISLDDLRSEEVFKMIAKRDEAVIVQPFLEQVYKGEHRTLYLGAKCIGAIVKYPQGSYLANIAQGAKFEKAQIPESVHKHCELIAKDLLKIGIDFIAFDILDEMVTEVNITCPGLVNEVSTAMEMNLADNYADYFLK